MDLANINFAEFKFDPAPYNIDINMMSEQIEDNNFERDADLKAKINQFDTLASEKMELCSQITEEINNVRIENLKMQMELKSLKIQEEHLSDTHLDLKESKIESHCTYIFICFIHSNFSFFLF